MALTLLAGPANAGKVSRLLDRYLTELDREPVLIVPNRADVDRVERELLGRTGALLGGWIGTFDDLFERIARANGGHLRVASDVQRALVVRRAIAQAAAGELGASARFAGFADALGATLAELESGLLDPADLRGDLAELYGAYREQLAALGLHDRDLERRHAAERVAGDLAAWDGTPVFAYGFEDLTGAQWLLLRALAARADVTVSLPYEPGRAVFASLERTAGDLSRLAAPAIEELPPSYGEVAHPALGHLERALFVDPPPPAAPPLEGAIRFLEGAGARGTLELVGEELLELLRSGLAAEEIGVVLPSLERWRGPLDAALAPLGVPYRLEGRTRLAQTPYGHALLSLLRFAWLGGGRRELYAFLRSPYSGLARAHVDYLEGRLRGRAVSSPERVVEETVRLRGRPLPFVEELAGTGEPLDAVRRLAASMLAAAYGLEQPPVGAGSMLDLRAEREVATVLDELAHWQRLGGTLTREDVVSALERVSVRLGSAAEPGYVAVVDLLRARTRRFAVVFVLGLEEGSLPRRSSGSPFLDEETRRELDERSRNGRLVHPDLLARERYLFYTACTRASRRLYLVREGASDEGAAREPSPFWDEVRGVFDRDEVARWTRRRPLSAVTWPLETAPTERERLRALARLSASEAESATALATANGWERRLRRASGAFERPTQLRDHGVLRELAARKTFSVTELEAFADCSSIWFLERVVDPRSIDARVDARLRGQLAHQALFKFFSGLPRRLGSETVPPGRLEEALAFLRECLDEAIAGGVWIELTELERRELEHGLRRDLEEVVREEAEAGLPLVPRRFEVSFGSERSAPELQRGLELGDFALSGKIDRIDVDPFSARGIVQDYKSGKTAYSAATIESELRLQIPLYMLVLRDLVGIEPLGGLYRALAGERHARGLLRAEAARDGVPGFSRHDYVDEDAFWGHIERAKATAATFVGRIRAGDVRHDPKGGFPCPSWCELAPMCRVRRS